MCGITGFIGKKVDLGKMKILGIFNDTRGKHSCGIYFDGKTIHGVDKLARMPDLLAATKISKIANPKIMLMHSRSATMGDHTKFNAHPITITQDSDGNYLTNKGEGEPLLVGVHNGRIENYWDMRNDSKKELTEKEFNIDSKILFGALLLNKDNPKRILEAYKGAASLIYTLDQKSLLVFRGAAGSEEERPLYFLREPEGCYFSSLEEPLKIIKTGDNEPETLKENILFRVTAEGYEVVVEVVRKKEVKAHQNNHNNMCSSRGSYDDENESCFPYPHQNVANRSSNVRSVATTTSNILVMALKELDRKTVNSPYGEVRFEDFRYKKNGILLNGRVNISNKGVMGVPGTPEYWFYEGILVDKAGYIEIAHKMLDTISDVFIPLSHIARYPIFSTKLDDIFRNKKEYDYITYKGKVFDGVIMPMFCDHYYLVKQGVFTEKRPRQLKTPEIVLEDQVWVAVKKKNKQILTNYHTGKPVNLSIPKKRKMTHGSESKQPDANSFMRLTEPAEPEGALVRNLVSAIKPTHEVSEESIRDFRNIQKGILADNPADTPLVLREDFSYNQEDDESIAQAWEDMEAPLRQITPVGLPAVVDEEEESDEHFSEELEDDDELLENVSDHKLIGYAEHDQEEIIAAIDEAMNSYNTLKRPLPRQIVIMLENFKRAKDNLITDEY